MRLASSNSRPGATIPLVAICLAGLLGFVALALDLGILMIVRNRSQAAADAVALAGARTLNGDVSVNNNYNAVAPNTNTVAASNSIIDRAIDPASQLTVTVGDYYYDRTLGSFQINPTGRQTGNNWTLVQATISAQRPTAFAQLMGYSTLSAGATATAAHRPRDAVIIIDFSGSMRFDSMLGGPHGGQRTQSMNPDTVYPTWGQYAGNSAELTYSSDLTVSSGEVIGQANTAVATADAPLSVISRFYADTAAFGTTTPAFSLASSAFATTPGGDVPLRVNKGAGPGYAQTVRLFLGTTTSPDPTFELDGYAGYAGGAVNATTSAALDYAQTPFYGYTQGPGYWGKTFMLWPPDPRVPLTNTYYTNAQITTQVSQALADLGITGATATTISSTWNVWAVSAATMKTQLDAQLALGAITTSQRNALMRLYNRIGAGMPKNGAGVPVPCDWRARFYRTPAGGLITSNASLFSAGAWQVPSSTTFLINYDAILDWIRNSGPNPFPNQLRAGGVVYYTAIPTTINVNTFPPTDPNQRFWKEYIDEVLGFQQTGGSGSSPTYSNVDGYSGYGPDITWGTLATTAAPTTPAANPPYMTYTDNPRRPLLKGWFGPLSLVDFLGNYNAADPSNNNSPRLWWPGTVPESPTYQAKLAIQAALKDIFRNHPNDNVSLVYFSSPRSSATGTGYYNYARTPLGRDQRLMINSLWFSPKVITTNAEISVYNSSGVNPGDIYDVPRANGGTCYAMPLMLAYNQFSANPDLVNYTANATAGTAGGLGRNGAAKLLIFETDGMVNTGAAATLVSSTTGLGYYRVRLANATNYSAAGSEFPTGVTGVTFSTGATQSQTITQQICNDLSAGGFSSTRKPVKVHCIAFGTLFEPTTTSTSKTNALQNLAALEVIGKVQAAGATTLASDKIIIGDFNSRINNLQAAFSSIMQDGVQVTLLSSGTGRP